MNARKESYDLKNKITLYWGRRSTSFYTQRKSELHDPIAQRWIKEIRKQLPKKEKLKILDIGCGSGFFTILLSKENHDVTGIDLTPEMIETALLLSKEEKANCTFQVMDAETLDFPEETFDVVISRNLTWTLPNPQKAYKEWVRILKKGGILLNFDANYGLEESTAIDKLPENHAHHTLSLAMLEENDAIKKQLPISKQNRPAWDFSVLSQFGIRKFQIDLDINKRIYVKKDAFYNPTPLFLLRGEKS